MQETFRALIAEMGGEVVRPMPTKEQGYGIATGGRIIHELGCARMGNDPDTVSRQRQLPGARRARTSSSPTADRSCRRPTRIRPGRSWRSPCAPPTTSRPSADRGPCERPLPPRGARPPRPGACAAGATGLPPRDASARRPSAPRPYTPKFFTAARVRHRDRAGRPHHAGRRARAAPPTPACRSSWTSSWRRRWSNRDADADRPRVARQRVAEPLRRRRSWPPPMRSDGTSSTTSPGRSRPSRSSRRRRSSSTSSAT